MPRGLNKKVLCFVDEYGTAGAGDLYLGAVIVLARDAGRVDKSFSDQLEPNASEIHAVALDDGYLQGLLQRFGAQAPVDRLVMLNRKSPPSGAPGPLHYAQALVETVKIGLRQFRTDVLGRDQIGNVDVILDITTVTRTFGRR